MSLLVVGALHWDVVVRAPRLPRLDETLRGSDVAYRLGGKGGNQAMAAAGAGARVAFAGRIGADDAGRAMRAELVAAGVDVARLQEGHGASGMSVAITEASGGYAAVIVSGENLEIDPDALTLPEGCRIVLAQNEVDPGLLPQLARLARAGAAELWLNAAPAAGLSPEVLRLVDVLIVNRLEAADLAGVAPDLLTGGELVLALQSLAPQARILVTLGADGVAHAAAGGVVERFAADAVAVVSTHGAGDMFVGSLAAAVLRGDGWPEAIRFAQGRAAALIAAPR
jgi:ribokinase